MQFKVNRPFRWNGDVRMPGQTVEMGILESGRLRAMGLIGAIPPQPERAVNPPAERRTAPPPTEKRTYKPRKK